LVGGRLIFSRNGNCYDVGSDDMSDGDGASGWVGFILVIIVLNVVSQVFDLGYIFY